VLSFSKLAPNLLMIVFLAFMDSRSRSTPCSQSRLKAFKLDRMPSFSKETQQLELQMSCQRVAAAYPPLEIQVLLKSNVGLFQLKF